MIILGINRSSHDASVCLMENGEIIFHIEAERLSNIKHDNYPFQAINLVKKYVEYIDILAVSGLKKTGPYDTGKEESAYAAHVLGLGKTFFDHGFKVYDFSDKHHQIHAATAFYNSGFESALCIVKDGAGSDVFINDNKDFLGIESGSVFTMQYPDNIELVEQHITTNYKLNAEKMWIDENRYLTNTRSEGGFYEKVAEKLGFTTWDAGKVMGMSAYGESNNLFPPIYKNNLINTELYSVDPNDFGKFDINLDIKNNFIEQANFAYSVQSEIQKNVCDYVLSMLEKTKERNLCLSGGFFLNCVSNYNLLKNLPKNIKIYVEPMSTDAGNALGVAKYVYYNITKSNIVKKQKNIYYGPKYNYTKNDIDIDYIENVNEKMVAELISNQNIVAIYQGRSEQGPRALGNRSILYDPRDKNGKNHVNIVKKREWFRPFAGSVLEEEAKNWFDLKSLKESKFMMFAVDVLKDKQSLIPAITHIDGTCRIQTVSKEDNKIFYNLIKEFYKITNIPILFNTSFNLAGNAIVETLQDAIYTLKNSKINYLYLPEMCILIKNPNDIIERR
jgi:carbamoyltransferase